MRYVGQPVAAVVADSRAEAEDLAEQVEVDYEPLTPIIDPRAGESLRALGEAGGRRGGSVRRGPPT